MTNETSTEDFQTIKGAEELEQEINNEDESKATVEKIIPQESLVKNTEEFLKILEPIGLRAKYQLLIEAFKMIKDGKAFSMIVEGEPGLAKTSLVRSVFNEGGLTEGEEYIIVSGHMTDKRLYEICYEFRHDRKILVFDDVEIGGNNTSANILKSLTDNKKVRRVSWESSRKSKTGVPSAFNFNAGIIIITNGKIRDKAIKDRAIHERIKLSTIEKLDYIEHVILPLEYKESSLENRRYVFTKLQDLVINGFLDFSLRTFHQLLDALLHSEEYFDTKLDSLKQGEEGDCVGMYLKIQNEHPDKKVFEKIEIFKSLTGKKRRTYFYTQEQVKDLLKYAKSLEDEIEVQSTEVISESKIEIGTQQF